MVMASGTATLKMSTFDDTTTSWERRVQICSAIEKTYVPNNNGLSHSLDIHTNSKDMHPVDMLTRVVEAEGIRQLLMMTKKEELQKMCEHGALVDADPNDKRQMIKLILQTWTDIGTKKFLKKVSDAQIVTICKNLGISPIPAFSISSDRNVCVEQIIRQLHIIGLENFSKKVADENVKNILEHTSKSQQPDRLQIPTGKKNGDSRGERAHSGEKSGASSTSRSSSREHGMAKSQEILKKTPKSKKEKEKDKDKNDSQKEKEKEKDKDKNETKSPRKAEKEKGKKKS